MDMATIQIPWNADCHDAEKFLENHQYTQFTMIEEQSILIRLM